MRRALIVIMVAASAAHADPRPRLPVTEPASEAMGTLAADTLALARGASVHPDELGELAGVLLQHASVTGRLDDYVQADVASARWIARAPARPEPHLVRAKVLATLHRFDDARRELARARALGANASTIELAEIDLDQATQGPGALDRAIAARAQAFALGPNLVSATMYALALAERGDTRGALALMPRALATWRDPSAVPFTWFLFQWARLAEEQGDLVTARALYEEAHRRLPRHGEAGRHLAALLIAAGDDHGARALLDALDAADPHPETTAMRAQLALRTGDPRGAALRDDARAGWERYLAAFPAAFADHAARFYLGVGADPARALALAEANLANRATAEAHALVIDAALAAGQPARACEVATRLVALGAIPRRHRFSAWKAFATCGRAADAERLAGELGIGS